MRIRIRIRTIVYRTVGTITMMNLAMRIRIVTDPLLFASCGINSIVKQLPTTKFYLL